MASGVQKCDEEQRIIVKRGVALISLFRLIAAVEKESGQGEQSARKKFPGTREECSGLGYRCCRGGHEGGARDVRSRCHYEKGAGSFAARLACSGHKPFHGEGGQQ